MWHRELWADSRHALRQMRRQPALTALVLLALGVGVGACLALGTVAESLFLKRLPFPAEEQVSVFWQDYSWTAEEYDFLKGRTQAYDRLAVFSTDGGTYSPNAAATTSVLTWVVSSPTLFDVLGVKPMMGHVYTADDDRPDALPVIVVSETMWRQDLGADPNVVGRKVIVDGAPVTVIGVMPKGFFFPTPELRAWRPLRVNASSGQYKNGFLTVVARARVGASPTELSNEIQRIAKALGSRFTYPQAWDKTRDAHALPVRTYLLGDVRLPMLFLLAAVVLLFLIACANGASLILARTSDRAGELAVRAALGAGGARLARQLVAESLVLSGMSAVIGMACAAATFRLTISQLPLRNGFDQTIGLGWSTLAIAFGLSLFTGLVISWVPARRLLSARGLELARDRSHQGLHRGTHRVHGMIVGAQVSLAMLLVVGAALLTRTVSQLRAIDLGFDPGGVVVANAVGPSSLESDVRRQWDKEIMERLAALPGVTAVGTTNRLPLRDFGFQSVVRVEGRPDLDGPKRPNSLYRAAGGQWFRAIGMRFIEGRAFDQRDGAGSPPVVILSEAFAREMWPGQRALGKHIIDTWSGKPISREVVGVVAQPRLTSVSGKQPFAIWVPAEQSRQGVGGVFTVRSTRPATSMISEIRRTVTALHPELALTRMQAMDDVVATSMAQPLRLRFFLDTLAVVALALGAIGIFGVISYMVARRTPELALRMALGAAPSDISTQILQVTMTPVIAGVIAGGAMALGARSLVARLLYGISPIDAPSFVAAGAALLVSAGLAAAIPMLRAARTNPADALKG